MATLGDQLGEALIERAGELERLQRHLHDIALGRGGTLIVEGAAGIGKTRLLGEAVRLARAAGLSVASARGAQLEREYAFGVTRQLFERRLDDEGASAELLGGGARLAEPVFSEAGPGTPADAGDDAQAVIHGLHWLAVNLAQRKPLLITLDDAHWADAPSLRWLAYLMNRVEDLPLGLVVTARPSEPDAPEALLRSVLAHPAAEILSPGPLSEEGIASITAEALGTEPAEAFVSACADLTQGNPLYVHAAIAAAWRERIAPDAAGAARLRNTASADVARSVVHRLASLSPDASLLARALAVLEHAPDAVAVAQLAQLTAEQAAGPLQGLIDVGLTNPEGTEFLHPIVRAAVYDVIPVVERGRLHAEAALLLAARGADDEHLAPHFLASAPRGQSAIVARLESAAARATARGGPEVAATLLRRALAEPPEESQRPQLLFRLGLAEVAAAGTAGTERIEQAIDLEPDPRTRAEMGLQLGKVLFTQSRFLQASAALEKALASAGSLDRQLRDRVEAHLKSIALLDRQSLARAGGLASIAVELDDLTDDPSFAATAAWTRVATEAPARTGAAIAQTALSSGALSVEDNAVVFGGAAVALMAAGHLVEAEAAWDEAITGARSRASMWALNFSLALRAPVLMRLGRVAEAEADIREIVGRGIQPSPESEEFRGSFPWVLAPLLDALVERGELDEATGSLRVSGLESPYPEQLQFIYLLGSIGRLRLAQGRPQEAEHHLRDCGERLAAWGVLNPGFVAWRAHLAEALLAQRERAEAVRLAREAVAAARAFEVERELGIALRVLGLALGDSAGMEALRESVSTLRASPARLELARSLTELGASLRAAGKRSDARRPLREGLDLATRCGATALASRALEELVATGAKPRRTSLSGVTSLTASELRVATMAADGMSNRRIAESLFVTDKTIEGHLSNAYRKLDIGSRSELPGALA